MKRLFPYIGAMIAAASLAVCLALAPPASAAGYVGIIDQNNAQTCVAANPCAVTPVGGVAVGSANVNAPVVTGGTNDGTQTGTVTADRVTTNGITDMQQCNASGTVCVGAVAAVPVTGNGAGANTLPSTIVITTPNLWNGTNDDVGVDAKDIVATGAGVVSVEEDGRSFANITTATTTTVKSGAGYLHTVCINKTVASATVSMFNNTVGSGASIGVITMPSTLIQSATCQTYDVYFSTGLTLVTVGAQDITVSYR